MSKTFKSEKNDSWSQDYPKMRKYVKKHKTNPRENLRAVRREEKRIFLRFSKEST